MNVLDLLNFVLEQKMPVHSATLNSVVFQKTYSQAEIPMFVIALSKATYSPVPRDFIIHTKVPQIYKIATDDNSEFSQPCPRNFMVFQPRIIDGVLVEQDVMIPVPGCFLIHPFAGGTFEQSGIKIQMMRSLHSFICENFGANPLDEDVQNINFTDCRWSRADGASIHQINAAILLNAMGNSIFSNYGVTKFTTLPQYEDWAYIF